MKAVPLCLLSTLIFHHAYTASAQAAPQSDQQRQEEIRVLRAELQSISARLSALEASEAAAIPQPSGSSTPPSAGAAPEKDSGGSVAAQNDTALSFLHDTTINFAVDGYYAYNFNQPAGRVNLLRAYDVSSNSFSLNQVDVMVEHLPSAAQGRRVGGRVDLQFGQATEALQGSSANEQRPQVWRNLFQAYGSYLAPLGSGLQIDFGKWSSALGIEGNYTKDQINYSRSYLFAFLPSYHMGVRANYNVTPKVNLAYWLVNGTQQTEDFNGFKSQALLVTLKPSQSLSWSLNYYFGQDQRDVARTLNPGLPQVPVQPGLPTGNATSTRNGREHILDSYATWNATSHLTVVGEADYVINQVQQHSAATHVAGGAAYLRYTLPANWAVAARAEYVSDRGGLFSGTTQSLKETTFTLERQLDARLIMRAEYRRDFSNQRYFLTDRAGLLDKSQSTATVGLVYWWGMKQGNW